MIGFIKGRIHQIIDDYILLENNGIGYKIFYVDRQNLKIGEEYLFYTYMQVREDDLSLYGFLDFLQYQLFMKLISVKGLGSKTACNILSRAKTEQIINAIDQGDVAFIKSLPGIGNKTASQIILDLKGKLIAQDNNESDEYLERMGVVIGGLKSLGFKQAEINSVIKALKDENLSDERLLKKALTLLQKKNK